MGQPRARVQWEKSAAIAERPAPARRPWRTSGSGVGGARAAVRAVAPVGGRASPADLEHIHEEVVAGARALARKVRALQERYEEEHRRLADTLEFLSVQSRDLERELASFGVLADRLELGVAAPPGQPGGPTALLDHPVPRAAGGGLTVRCLGAFELAFRGRPLDLGSSRKGRLVFKYLVVAAHAGRASKEKLADLFWPDAPLELALQSLQSAVYQLKRALGRSAAELAAEPAVAFVDDHYTLNPRLELSSDLQVFRRSLAEARVFDARGSRADATRAYQLARRSYGGELLPEERYEEWVMAERASLEADYLAILTRLVHLGLDAEAYDDAVEAGRALLELDGTREDIHRDLMRCHSRRGQRGAALRQYHRCAESLEQELEIEPDEETTALFRRLSDGEMI